MRSKRVPDRVHVVRTPEQDDSSRDGNHDLEIVRMLSQISDKLKRSEQERAKLKAELSKHRNALLHLEDKTDGTEKAFLTIENKLRNKGTPNEDLIMRQARLEKQFKESEQQMIKSVAGQAVIDKRLKLTEQRLEENSTEQTRLSRQLELTTQDKSRINRKIERLEEIVTETQDTLRAKAMVLLTDQSSSAQADLSTMDTKAARHQKVSAMSESDDATWWDVLLSPKSLVTASVIAAALLAGWGINKIQRPTTSEVAVVENNNSMAWESAQENEDITPATNLSDFSITKTPAVEAEPETLAVKTPENYDGDAALMNALDKKTETTTTTTTPEVETPKVVAETPAIKNFDEIAYVQNTDIENKVLAERSAEPLSQRIQADAKLPEIIKRIEKQAFAGNAESQHDLAAIYTAGHGGVDQNFEKAAFWFLESSDQNVANAQYNLGVLYHQGLGKEQDLGRALYWYRNAAKLNHAEAQYNLGIAHIEGIGTDYNPALAAEFFERAANNGIIEAAYNLGLIYENGLLGQAKPDEALLWYKVASDQGNADAKNALNDLTKTLQIDAKDVDKMVERMQSINEATKGRRAGPASATVNQSTNTNSAPMVKQAQEYLSLTGIYTGPIDGINGEKTQNSIRSYQKQNGLSVDGKASKELLTSMMQNAAKYLEEQKTN